MSGRVNNMPADQTLIVWGVLLVMNASSYINQVYWPNYGAVMFLNRVYYSGSWHDWHSVNRTT